MDHDTRASLKADIAGHFLENGSRAWNRLRDRYPHVPPATFWRYVKKVRDDVAAAAAVNSPDHPENSSSLAGEIVEPAVELPARFLYLKSLRGRDVIVELASIMEDAEILRRDAFDSKGNVRRPHQLLASIGLRRQIIDFGLAAIHDIYDLEHQQRLYERVIEIVAVNVPAEDRRKVMAELMALERDAAIQRDEGYDFSRPPTEPASTPASPG